MAGSQLKKLKATLKEAGLTGQTNVKQKVSATPGRRRPIREEMIEHRLSVESGNSSTRLKLERGKQNLKFPMEEALV